LSNKSNDEGPLSQEMKAQKHRTLQFIEEVKTRGGFKKLYHAEHTNKIINQQNISLDNFYKLFERMVDGAGLFGNPVLLSAVLKDIAYPADCLFQDDNIHQSSTCVPEMVSLGFFPDDLGKLFFTITGYMMKTEIEYFVQLEKKTTMKLLNIAAPC